MGCKHGIDGACTKCEQERLAAEVERLREEASDARKKEQRAVREYIEKEQELAAERRKVEALTEACQTLVTLPDNPEWIGVLRKAVEQARAALAASQKGGE